MSAELKINRIRSRHKAEFNLLGEVTKTAMEAIPKLQTTAHNRAEFRAMADVLSTLGKHTRVNGFDPTRTFQHVANFDTEIWTLILDMFAKTDPETGEPMDDGLLYKYDPVAGCVKLNKDFFFALVSYFEAQGITCDMRGKIKLT